MIAEVFGPLRQLNLTIVKQHLKKLLSPVGIFYIFKVKLPQKHMRIYIYITLQTPGMWRFKPFFIAAKYLIVGLNFEAPYARTGVKLAKLC